MDPQLFDTLTRHLSRAGSRRRVLTALVASALGRVQSLPRADRVAASGECDNPCPTDKPCCIKGKCRETCVGGTCCADCFAEVLLINEKPVLVNPVCCESPAGTICEHKKSGPGDDRCCYPNQVCVKGKCCCDECEGAMVCGGKCCAIAACCNGKCCKKGEICATKEEGGEETCVRANRDCVDVEECYPGETCHGGTCCSGLRVCGDGEGNDVCCKAGERCEFQGEPNAECCPVNTICKGTYRGHRVRR
jgi:hypothetical protein